MVVSQVFFDRFWASLCYVLGNEDRVAILVPGLVDSVTPVIHIGLVHDFRLSP